MNIFPMSRLQRELQSKDWRNTLRRQTALQITIGALKIVAGLREMLFGSVTVLRDRRRRSSGIKNLNRMMMCGDNIERVQDQAKQHRSDNS